MHKTFRSEDLGVSERIVLERVIGKCALDSSGSGQEPAAVSCERRN
jgi:hypothetical protein